jgi:hypothetical protein
MDTACDDQSASRSPFNIDDVIHTSVNEALYTIGSPFNIDDVIYTPVNAVLYSNRSPVNMDHIIHTSVKQVVYTVINIYRHISALLHIHT